MKINEDHIPRGIALKIVGVADRTFRDLDIDPVSEVGRAKFYGLADLLALRDERTARVATQDHLDAATVYDENGEIIDIAHERAMKIRAERIGQEIKNAEALGELAPLDLMRSALGDALRAANQWIETVPSMVKRAHPEISGAALDTIERGASSIRNSIADARIRYTDPRMQPYSRKPE